MEWNVQVELSLGPKAGGLNIKALRLRGSIKVSEKQGKLKEKKLSLICLINMLSPTTDTIFSQTPTVRQSLKGIVELDFVHGSTLYL